MIIGLFAQEKGDFGEGEVKIFEVFEEGDELEAVGAIAGGDFENFAEKSDCFLVLSVVGHLKGQSLSETDSLWKVLAEALVKVTKAGEVALTAERFFDLGENFFFEPRVLAGFGEEVFVGGEGVLALAGSFLNVGQTKGAEGFLVGIACFGDELVLGGKGFLIEALGDFKFDEVFGEGFVFGIGGETFFPDGDRLFGLSGAGEPGAAKEEVLGIVEGADFFEISESAFEVEPLGLELGAGKLKRFGVGMLEKGLVEGGEGLWFLADPLVEGGEEEGVARSEVVALGFGLQKGFELFLGTGVEPGVEETFEESGALGALEKKLVIAVCFFGESRLLGVEQGERRRAKTGLVGRFSRIA